MSSDKKQVILVTGANKGIGYEAVRQLSEQLPSATILLGTRSLSNGQAAISKMQATGKDKQHTYSNVHLLELEVTDKQSIAKAVQKVKQDYGHLDVLINNSGISNIEGDLKHKQILTVNLYGLKDTTDAFLPLLSRDGILLNVGSELGSVSTHAASPDLQQQLLNVDSLTWEQIDALAKDAELLKEGKSKWPDTESTYGVYGISKALVHAYTRKLALEHPELKIAVVTPGYCATDLNQFRGPRSAAQGGESVAWPVTHPFKTGLFYKDGQEVPFSKPLSFFHA